MSLYKRGVSARVAYANPVADGFSYARTVGRSYQGLADGESTISLYRRGAGRPAVVGNIIDDTLDEMVPNRVLRELNLINDDVKGTHKELFNAIDGKDLTEPLADWVVRGPWSSFVEKWNHFYDENKGWGARFMSGPSIYRRAQELRNELIQLRTVATTLGMEWHSPDPIGPRERDDVFGTLFRFLRNIAYILAGGAALYLLIKLVRN